MSLSAKSSTSATTKISVDELVFDATNWNVPQEVKVIGNNNKDKQRDFTISYSVSSQDIRYKNEYISVNEVSVSATDEDVKTVVITPGVVPTEPGTYNVKLSAAPTADVQVTAIPIIDGEPRYPIGQKILSLSSKNLNTKTNKELKDLCKQYGPKRVWNEG